MLADNYSIDICEKNVLYDLSGVEIGEYNKDEVTKLLDKGIMKHYKYADVGGTYKFEKIDG